MIPLLLAFPLFAVTGAVVALALRNALLARRLEEIRAAWKKAAGAQADFASARLETDLALVLEGVVLPIGGGLVVEEARARIANVPAAVLGRGSLRFESLEGVLRLRDATGAVRIEAPGKFLASREPPEGALVHGRVELRGGRWTHGRPELGAAPLADLDATLEIARGTWRLADARLTCSGAALAGELAGRTGEGAPRVPRFVGKVEGVRAPLLAHLLALTGVGVAVERGTVERVAVEGGAVERAAVEGAGTEGATPATRPVLPRDLEVSGEVALEPDLARRGKLALATPTSRLDLALALGPEGDLAGSRLTGRVSTADALAARLFQGRFGPLPGAHVEVDLAISGKGAGLLLKGPARAPRLELGGSGRPSIALEDVTVELVLGRERVAWESLVAHGLGGEVRATGSLEFGREPGSPRSAGPASEPTEVGPSPRLATKLAWRGVMLEAVPTGPGEVKGLAQILRGRASGEVDLAGIARAAELRGEGKLVLEESEHLYLVRATPALRDLGLPALATRALGPCEARVVLEAGRIELREISGRVPDLAFDGRLGASFGGEISGALTAHLEESFLSRSVLLALPSAFTGRVSVPIQVRGRHGAPVYEADLLGALGGLLKRNRVTSVLAGVMDGILGGLFGEARPRTFDIEALLDRILAGGREGDVALERLTATGLSAAEVERLVAERRRRLGS